MSEVPLRPIDFGDLTLDLARGCLRRGQTELKLRPKSFAVLRYLVENQGRLVSKEELIRAVWAEAFVTDNSLVQCLIEIRRALGEDGQDMIRTVPRRGYIFEPSRSGRDNSRTEGPMLTSGLATLADLDVPPNGTARGNHSQIAKAGKTQDECPERASHPSRRHLLGQAAVLLALMALTGAVAWKFWTRQQVSGNGTAKIRSIAVLPLKNLSSDQEQEFFADGMTEALITDLGKANSLRVISHTSANHYKDSKLPIPEIARSLGVDAVVEGTVARSGGRVRVTANLIQAYPEKHLWAEAYERDLRDVLAMQDDIARSIAYEVQAKAVPGNAAQPKPVNPEAYREYLWGRRLFGTFTRDGEDKALEHLDRAIRLDPTLALAYATRAEVYAPLVGWGAVRPRESLAKAEADARRALALDDTLPDAHVGMAGVHVMRNEWAEAEQEFQRAIALNPNHYMAHDWHGYLLGDIGNHDGEMAEMKIASELDPVSEYPHKSLAAAYLHIGQYDAGIKEAQKALELNPAFDVARGVVARCYEEQRKYTEAIAEFQKLGSRASLAHAYARSGNKQQALAILHTLEQEAKTRYISHRTFAVIRVGLGQNEAAVTELEKADQDGESFDYMNQDSRFTPLRTNPRYVALLRRHGLASEQLRTFQ